MKASIHPEYQSIKVTCSCGNSFETKTTIAGGKLAIEVCSQCHPFYTGKQKLANSGGRVQRFRERYKFSQAQSNSSSDAASN